MFSMEVHTFLLGSLLCYCAVFPTQYVASTFDSLGPGLPVQGLVATPVGPQLIQMELPESFIEP